MPFFTPPKLPILGVFGDLGGTKNGSYGGLQSMKLWQRNIDNGPGPGRYKGETVILQMLHILASILECKSAIFFKLFPKQHFTVYNPEILFVTSYNPIAWVVN